VSADGSGFTAGNPAAPEGAQVAFLQGQASAQQTFALAAGTYTLSLAAAQRGNFNPDGPQTVRVVVDGALVGSFAPSGAAYQSFTTAAFTLAGAGPRTVRLETAAAGEATALVDDVRIAPVMAGAPADGGFESPAVGAGGFQYAPGGGPWAFSATAGVSADGSGFTAGNPAAPEGAQVAFLQGQASAQQTFALAAGTYTLSLAAAQRGNFNPDGPQTVRVVVDGALVGSFAPSGAAYQSFTTAAFTLAGAGPRTVRLETAAAGEATALVDDVRIAPAPAVGLTIGLLADTDRNGTVGASDLDGRGDWTSGRGAIFSVNLDDDDRNGLSDAVTVNDQGVPVGENFVVEGAADALDLAPLVIRALGPSFNAGTRAFLVAAELEDVQSFHLFPTVGAGAVSIWGGLGTRAAGGTAQPLAVDVTQFVSGTQDVTFGLEGLFFRNTSTANPRLTFDGFLDLRLEVYQDGAFVGQDAVRMKVAPWILVPDTQPSVRAFAADFGAQNASMLYTAAADPGYFGLDASGQLQTITPAQGAGTQWIQDQVEMGYTQRPGGPVTTAVFRLPYSRGAGVPQPAWPQNLLLGPDLATFQLGVNLGGGSGDYGGNVELLPPTANNPLGRIIHGDTGSNALFTFFQSQEVQAPFRVPTQWLIVGHADEIVGFDDDGRVMIADSRTAYDLLEAIPVEDRGRAVFFATGADPVSGTATGGGTRRILTGMDLTGQDWQFIRIYDSSGSGSGAAGQVARIAPGGLGNGFVDVDLVWSTTSNVVEQVANGPSAQRWATTTNPPSQTNWFNTPRAGDRFVLVEGTRSWRGTISAPAFITVAEVLADPVLRALHESNIQPTIDAVRGIMEEAAGGPGVLEFVSVPVLYFGRQAGFQAGRRSVAFTPGLQNSPGINGTLYMPRQFGPRDSAGQDIFETYAAAELGDVRFVDDWDLYHRLLGEVHCGVIVQRLPFAFDWWAA
jgi:hypothetical protein